MPRTEAVRVLGAMVKFGEAAATALTAGLGSSKSFLRHGCALALGMLRTEQGTEAVIDLLLAEPTEIWRELARAVGQIGPAALMPLAARLGRLGDRLTPPVKERAAWAMAHIGVRGGRAAVETLAGGHSVVAPVARAAVDLLEPAARDDLRGTGGGKEVTVNRAFSRKFFEAIGRPVSTDPDASGPMELLDEADLIDVDGDEDADEELDESDLIDA
jgi:HEAT repeat protein